MSSARLLWPVSAERSRVGSTMTRRQRFALTAALYLVADIGYAFFFGALTAILLAGGIRLEQVALINLLGLVYFGRFLIGPVVDRLGSARLGHYRGWLVVTQLVLVVVWLALIPIDPARHLSAVLVLMAMAMTVSSLHDTAMNGFTVRLLRPEDRGIGNGIQSGMASLSIVLGSGGALLLYSHAGWGPTVAAIAALYLIPFVLLWFAGEPPGGLLPRRGRPYAELWTLFRQRRVRVWALVVVPMFTLGGFLATSVQIPMMVAAGWSLNQIAVVQGSLSGIVGLIAGLGAGMVSARTTRRRAALLAGGFWAGASGLLLPLSTGGSTVPIDAVAVLLVTAGYSAMAVCVYAVSMDLSRPASAATDFTAQTSVLGVIRLLTNSVGPAMAGAAGFSSLIVASVLLGVSGTWITSRWLTRHSITGKPVGIGHFS